ncbi:MAG: hypothetical protein J2P41_18265, partial [Blastocatellia bacterium]|nr:hypothetical protein [Blastocatellia bacterium]
PTIWKSRSRNQVIKEIIYKMRPLACSLLLLLAFGMMEMMDGANPQTAPPVYVTLWLDTEDYILPQSDDAAKRLAETLTRLNVKATFKVVGEKARTLERRGRQDVITALKKHDIGYHSNTHSQQPTIAVYLRDMGWDEGAAEFYRREAQGALDVERIFGVKPVCYGQPGASWAPQVFPALKRMGIGMYLDEGDHVGLNEQPFYYCGLLNVYKMGVNQIRMDLSGGDSLARGKNMFQAAYDRLRAQGGGLLSVMYHPCEFVHAEFWDGVNFRHGANPPRSEWKAPPMRPAQETEKAFSDFEQYIKFIKTLPGARFVTASEMIEIYADPAPARSFSREEIVTLAKEMRNEITFHKFAGYSLSAADAFALLNESVNGLIEKDEMPAEVKLAVLEGPARSYNPPAGRAVPTSFSWTAFSEAVHDTAASYRAHRRIPAEIWFGAESLAPKDYLATLATVIVEAAETGRKPEEVKVQAGNFTADKFVAADATEIWNWPIHPVNFQAPKLMELARLQAWTLKPAILHR